MLFRRLNSWLRKWLGDDEGWKYLLTGAGVVILGILSGSIMLLNALMLLI